MLLLLAGCNRQPETSRAAGAVFQMPQGWPLSQIQVPQDAQSAELPGAFPSDEDDPQLATGLPFNPQTKNAGKMWSVAFTSTQSWEQQLAAFTAQHEELHYNLNWDKPLTREYISPDGLFITQLHLDPDKGVSVLSIFAYDESWPGARPFGT
jgi:hypothetical protein